MVAQTIAIAKKSFSLDFSVIDIRVPLQIYPFFGGGAFIFFTPVTNHADSATDFRNAAERSCLSLFGPMSRIIALWTSGNVRATLGKNRPGLL